jgi:competence protein ComEC
VRRERLLNFLIVVSLVAGLLVPSAAVAVSSTTVKLWIGSASMSVNGVQKPIDAQGTTPVIVQGRTLVPIRAVIEAFGGSVTWEASARKVTVALGKNSLDLWIDKPRASLNGKTLAIDSSNPAVVPIIVSGRTMLPLRFVAESLGIDVQYEATAKMITLTFAPQGPPASTSPLRVDFLDVGQGDSILIRTPNASWVLIDAGSGHDGATVVAYLKAQGVKTLAAIVCTHPHEDHIGGMKTVIEQFAVTSVYMPKASTTTQAFENLLLAIQAKGLTIRTAQAGVDISVDTSTTMRFLSPVRSSYENLNDYSAVMKVTRGSVSFLLMGDASSDIESDLQSSSAVITANVITANVLKAGHHGSATSSSASFLLGVQPKYAVIQVGSDNSYGHPTTEALSRLSAAGAAIYRTDLDGTVSFTTDGTTLSVDKQPSGLDPGVPPVDPPVADTVYRTATGSKYHHLGCQYLKSSSIAISRSDAIARGLTSCSVCKP